MATRVIFRLVTSKKTWRTLSRLRMKLSQWTVLTDPLIGPRATQAISDLVTASGDPSFVPADGAVWQQIIDNGGGAFDDITGNTIVFQKQ